MKGAISHLMMFLRKPILIISKLVIGFFFLFAIITFVAVFIAKDNTFNILSISILYLAISFIVYLFVDKYDRILLKLKPDDIDIALFK